MDRKEPMCCHQCGSELSDEQIHALRGITGLRAEQLVQYNLRLYCQRCEQFRKRKSSRIGYFILLALLLILTAILIL